MYIPWYKPGSPYTSWINPMSLLVWIFMILLQMSPNFWFRESSSFYKCKVTKHDWPTEVNAIILTALSLPHNYTSFARSITQYNNSTDRKSTISFMITLCSINLSQGISLRTDGDVSIKCMVASWVVCGRQLCCLCLNSKKSCSRTYLWKYLSLTTDGDIVKCFQCI